MAIIYDHEHPTSIPHFTPRRPASVRKLAGAIGHNGVLVLRWEPPRNGTPVTTYRLERTPDGKTYETLGETTECRFVVQAVPGESWFYRVSAVNARGATRSTMVCLYRAGDRFMRGGHNLEPRLKHFPALPGVVITIYELTEE